MPCLLLLKAQDLLIPNEDELFITMPIAVQASIERHSHFSAIRLLPSFVRPAAYRQEWTYTWILFLFGNTMIRLCSSARGPAYTHLLSSSYPSQPKCLSQLTYYNKSHVLLKTSKGTRLNNEIIILTISINIIIVNNNLNSNELKYFNVNWNTKETHSLFWNNRWSRIKW